MDIKICFSNLFKFGDFDPFIFSLLGMGIVFCGLMIISIYIAVLPSVFKFFRKRKRAIKYHHVLIRMKENAAKDAKTDEIMTAIAVAIHLHQNYSDVQQKLTWSNTTPSAWGESGRIQNMSRRELRRG